MMMKNIEGYLTGNFLTTTCRKTIELSFNTFFLKNMLGFFMEK